MNPGGRELCKRLGHSAHIAIQVHRRSVAGAEFIVSRSRGERVGSQWPGRVHLDRGVKEVRRRTPYGTVSVQDDAHKLVRNLCRKGQRRLRATSAVEVQISCRKWGHCIDLRIGIGPCQQDVGLRIAGDQSQPDQCCQGDEKPRF
jgi:hypothetical protein